MFILNSGFDVLCCADDKCFKWRNCGWSQSEIMVMEHSNKRQFSSLGQNILGGADDPGGDALIKKIFSNREVLAWLLVNFIDEYKGCTVQEVMEKYLPKATLMFGQEAVHAGETLPENVPVSNSEDKELFEGMVSFDVLLMLPIPQRPDGRIGVVIDVEVQKNDSPGYPIESRMVYYLCRMISKQRGLTFKGSDYGSILKCYSLWFCPELKHGESPSIDCYFLARKRIFGKGDTSAAKSDYDLMEGYVCRFNNDPSQPVNKIIRYLQLLLTDIASPLERLNELHKKYGISKTREAEDMCNYSQYLVQKGENKGREEGKKEGREEEKLDILEQLEQLRSSDKRIMKILKIDAERLMYLRSKLQARQSAMADD